MTTTASRLDFSVALELVGCRWVAAVAGELDVATLPVLRSAIDAMPDDAEIVIDLRDSAFVSVDAVSWLARANRSRCRHGGGVQLRNPPPSVRRVLDATSLPDVALDAG
jgi:anti-anti-sigma factor